MNEKLGCAAIVYSGQRVYLCNNKAGYGPGKAYCKIHAREHGEKFRELVMLYRVKEAGWGHPLRIAQVQAEVTPKLYKLSGNDDDFNYANNLHKDGCQGKGIFTTPEEAIAWYVQSINKKIYNLKIALEKANKEAFEALRFAKENGLNETCGEVEIEEEG